VLQHHSFESYYLLRYEVLSKNLQKNVAACFQVKWAESSLVTVNFKSCDLHSAHDASELDLLDSIAYLLVMGKGALE